MWAENLLDRLHKNLLDTEETLATFIRHKLWEPLGFSSFATAWTARMSDITLAAELRPHVVYQMFAEGATVDEVVNAVKDVGPESAESLRRQREHGVPVGMAVVRQHYRKRPKRHFVTFEVDGGEKAEWESIAKAHNTTVDDVAVSAVRAAFAELR